MIIAFPNDGRGLLYHVVNLHGQTVHAYRDFDAACRAREGDQRIFILQEPINGRENRWLTDAPAPDSTGALLRRQQQEAAEARAAAQQQTYNEFERLLNTINQTEPDAQTEELERIRTNMADAHAHGLLIPGQHGELEELAKSIAPALPLPSPDPEE